MTNGQRLKTVLVPMIVVMGVTLWRQSRHPTPPPPAVHSDAATASPVPSVGSGTGAGSGSAQGVRRLDHAERQQLGAQIAVALQHARTAAAEAHPGSAVAADDPIIPLESVAKPMQAALASAIPLLAKCYEHAGSATPRTAGAQMTMASDPDLGTVIDTAAMTEADGITPLAKELDDCLRDTIESLALPPLGQPGKLQLQYTFRFD